ncbi:MAG TPA: ABC transporter substrate-binding protein, partial [Burkholderiales bacterium]|nr:ABC transporter substrate-binding protein [Burkholderiales bacterium]
MVRKTMMKLMMGMVAMLFLAGAPLRAQEIVAPDVLAKNVTDEVLALLRADKEIQAGNTKKVVDLVEKKVLPHFEFTRMTRLAVGPNWRQATPEQQKALVIEFRALLVQTYAATLTAYRNQVIDYRPLRMQPDDTEAV